MTVTKCTWLLKFHYLRARQNKFRKQNILPDTGHCIKYEKLKLHTPHYYFNMHFLDSKLVFDINVHFCFFRKIN